MHIDGLGSIKYNLDHDRHILFAVRDDALSKEKIFAEWRAIQQLDGFDPAYDTIVDYSKVPRVDLDTTDLLEINKKATTKDPRTGNVAIVSGLKPGHYLLARFFCKIANAICSRKYQVFQNSAEAEIWLFAQRQPGGQEPLSVDNSGQAHLKD